MKKLISDLDNDNVDVLDDFDPQVEDEELYREISGELSFRILTKAQAVYDYITENPNEIPLKKVYL